MKFNSVHYGNWEMLLNAIAILGEHTTEEGPFTEDFFLIVVNNEGDVYEVPVSSKGFNETLKVLSSQLRYGLEFKLSSSASFRSRVIYPVELLDTEIFNIVSRNSPKTFLDKIKFYFGMGMASTTSKLNDKIIAYLEQKNGIKN